VKSPGKTPGFLRDFSGNREVEKMQTEQHLGFGPYRFDPVSGQLWRGTLEVRLTPKALAVLRVLVTRPGQVATKDEIFQTVWSDTVVSDDALTSCIQELQQALGDDARQPQYIETVHRRGFRFLPTITTQPVISTQLSVISKKQGGRADVRTHSLKGRVATRINS
jgi:DNA-binding winged helix-turn-helix (wHTH) protein